MMHRGEGPRVELRFLITSKIAGVIIGRGGQSIKKLREDYAARISIPDSTGPERVMALEGELGTLMAMLSELLPRMEEASNHRGGPGNEDPNSGGMGLPGDGYEMGESGVDLRMLVHQSQVGCIIGRGGFNIRELREKLPLKLLKVHPSVCPSSTDRVVQMVGPVEVVLQCTQKLTEMLETAPPKGPRNNYNARSFNEYTAPEYGGYQSNRSDPLGADLIGCAGAAPGTSPYNSGTGIRGNEFDSHNICFPHSLDVPLHGGPMGDFTAAGAVGGNPYGAPGPSATGLPGAPPANVVPPSEKTTTQVSLPDKLTGSIMGRGGSRINQIRQQSGAEITIHPPEPGNPDRIITIRGSTDQIQKAQFLMQLCVKKFSGQY